MGSSAFAPPLPSGSTSVTDADIAALFGVNVNPVLNNDSNFNDVQILNGLGPLTSQVEPDFLSQLTSIDSEYLEGLPNDLWNFRTLFPHALF